MGSPHLEALLADLERTLTPEAAAALLTSLSPARIAEQRALEQSLEAFVRAAWHVLEPARPLTWNWHLSTICGYLEALARREILRLIIAVPPGSMKSLLASVFFPAWTWTWQATHRFLTTSNDGPLATRDALKMRRLVTSDWYMERWSDRVMLTGDQSEKTYYENTAGGFRQAQGYLAAVTGKRGDTVIVDDPHDVRSVDSEVKRPAVLDGWDQAWSNRKNDPATSAVLMIMQRSHSEDLAGYVLAKEGQDRKELAIPMRYDGPRFDAGADIGRPDLNDPRTEEGELMFPERFPEHVVDEAEQDLGSYGTAAQHQQRPAPKGGGEIKPEWFRTYRRPAETPGWRFALVDPAGERKPGRKGKKDHTAMGLFEARADGNVYLLDAVRDRIGLIERADVLFAWHRKWRPEITGYESYGMQSDLAHLEDRMEREGYRFRIVELGGALRKEDRIRRIIPRLERGGVYFPQVLAKTLASGKAVDLMAEVMKDEVLTFPVAKFDDFLDMLSRIEDLEQMHLLKFPIADAKPIKTFVGRASEGGAGWMGA